MWAEIEKLIAADDWERARKLIRTGLQMCPDDHWLLTCLGLTYYEQRRYKTALRYEQMALAVAPRCPLVLWDYAGTLEMLGRDVQALRIYRRLIRRGVKAIAFGECGEGLRRARGLVADCWYRAASCYASLGQRVQAISAMNKHLSMRGPGCGSIYTLREAQNLLARFRRRTTKQSDFRRPSNPSPCRSAAATRSRSGLASLPR